MSENKFEEIMEKDISIVFNTTIIDEEENEEEINVFKLKREYSKIDVNIANMLAEFIEEPVMEHVYNGYITNEKRTGNPLALREKVNEYDGDFCFDLDIYSKDKKIGCISLTRIFVDNKVEIIGFMDYESPQSMDIAHYICDKDFERVYGTYVAIYDCFILDKKYQGIGIEREIIEMLDSFLIEEEFEVSKTYIKAISISKEDYGKDIKSENMFKTLVDNEYKLEDSSSKIMSSEFWDFDEIQESLEI